MLTPGRMLALKIIAPLTIFGVLLFMPTPEGLTPEGQKALAIMALTVVWWATETLPNAVAGIVGMVLLNNFLILQLNQSKPLNLLKLAFWEDLDYQ